MGAMPHPENTEAEVLAYVKTLVAHDRIDYGGKKKSAPKRGSMNAFTRAGSGRPDRCVVSSRRTRRSPRC